MTRPARILFAGSPEFAVPMLDALCTGKHEVVAVLTQPDRPSGRGRRRMAGPVKAAAAARGIEVLQPQTLRDDTVQDALRGFAADLFVVVAYGLLLPPAVLDIPRVACVNVHASLLPRWRGAAPIQAAILAGDERTGVSLMQMDAGLDTGPVYATAQTRIEPLETAAELHDRLAAMGAALLSQHVASIVSGTATAQAQPDDGATYAGRLSKADAVIDWSDSALAIQRMVRAYNAWPVAETLLDGQKFRCWRAGPPIEAPASAPPGTIVAVTERGIEVMTGEGVCVLTEVQAPGRRRCSAIEFARGYPLTGKQLGV